jgi:hypothetical protein
MNAFRKLICATLSLAAVLVATSPAQAQSRPAATAPAATTQQANTPEAIFARWDTDHSKTLSVDEFKAGWREVEQMEALRNLHDNFIAKDSNRNGSLDAAEYANLDLIKKAGKSAPPMSTFDADKNQVLNFKEYVALVQSLLKSNP